MKDQEEGGVPNSSQTVQVPPTFMSDKATAIPVGGKKRKGGNLDASDSSQPKRRHWVDSEVIALLEVPLEWS